MTNDGPEKTIRLNQHMCGACDNLISTVLCAVQKNSVPAAAGVVATSHTVYRVTKVLGDKISIHIVTTIPSLNRGFVPEYFCHPVVTADE